MIRAVIKFEVKQNAGKEFESAFKDAGMFERPAKLEGFESMELIRCVVDRSEYLVVSTWQTEQAYEHWQLVSSAEAPREALKRLAATLVSPQPGKIYTVVDHN